MRCPGCGFENPDGFAFCGKCGARLTPSEFPGALITEADLARLKPYLPLCQLDDLHPASLWQDSFRLVFQNLKYPKS